MRDDARVHRPALRDTPDLPDGPVAYRVFLTGNTGDIAREGSEAVLEALAADARAAGEKSAVVLLGDETADGLPEGDAAALRPVEALGRALRGYDGRVVVLPGDRDWRQGRAGVKRLEGALYTALGDSVLTPGDQAGGPRDIELADGLRLFAIDTAWWLLDPDDRPKGEADGENVRTPADVVALLEKEIADRDDDRIVVVGHHPIRSNGAYAGQRTLGRSLLTLGVGPIVGQTIGTGSQSLAADHYREMRGVLDGVFTAHDRLVYASAHDRALETFDAVRSETNRQTYLVSGTGGGRAEAAAAGRGASHVLARPGYQRLVYFTDGSLWSETVAVDADATRVVFRSEIAGADPERVDPEVPDSVQGQIPTAVGGTVTVAPDSLFETGPFRNSGFQRFVWGGGYRDTWGTPVRFPVLDLGTEAGGLTPVKEGGGNQTTGLRLAGADGREYGLRLVEKGGTGQLPPELREGLAGDVVLDLRSAQTPYGAIVAYPLSRAAGVLIARPRLVYVPDDPRLGRYRETFADQIALLEVRADDDMRGVEGFDGVADVVSDGKMYEELRADQDHHVDQRAFLRARLVDMLIADWDRHRDQWRWAAYEPGELDPSLTGDAATQGKVYRPVAKDHDFAFYGIGGVIPFLMRNFADERLQPFANSFGTLTGLTANGFDQDRRFFNTLTRDDMEAAAREVQQSLSDSVIDAAVAELPAPIQALVGDRWRSTLKVRRDKLVRVADDLYDLHAGIVDVLGSDEREHVTATREADGRLSVVVRSGKDGHEDRVLYQRTFVPHETHEVRFYGFGGRDRVDVVGDGPEIVRVRIVGGAGRDTLDAPAGRTTVYDTPEGLAYSGDVQGRLSDRGDVNRYNSNENVLRRRVIFPSVAYNPTDGVRLGASLTYRVPGFRLAPFAATHVFSGSVATSTGGLAAAYSGRMRHAVAAVDLDLDASASTPRYVRNFYGLGNGTAPGADGAERIDIAQARFEAGFGGPLGQGLRLVAGPTVRYANVSRDSLRAGGSTPLEALVQVQPDAVDATVHAGAFARLELTTAYGGLNPRQGVTLTATGAYRAGVAGAASSYGQLGGDAAAYVPLLFARQLTLALRAGADTRFGDFPFFDAATLGGPGSLRGYRRQRFSGRTAASGGAELRASLFRIDTYAAPFTVGVLAFGDAGRVWADTPPCTGDPFFDCVNADPDTDSTIHAGYGGGLFLDVLDRAIATLNVGRSSEETLITFGGGFAF